MIQNDINFIIIIIIVSLIIVLIQLFMELRRRPSPREFITKTLLKCQKCGFRVERDFEPGDFVSMTKGKCPRCGYMMYVEAIYSIETSSYKRKT